MADVFSDNVTLVSQGKGNYSSRSRWVMGRDQLTSACLTTGKDFTSAL